MTITIETRTRNSLCTTVYLPGFLVAFETVRLDLERFARSVFSQMRNPPTNALALSPARQPGGNFFSFFDVSSSEDYILGFERGNQSSFTTSLTSLFPFFLPIRLRPATPT